MNGDYTLEYARSAGKDLERLPAKVVQQVVEAIRQLAVEPRPTGVAKVKGEELTYRIRVGRYRIIYEVVDRERRVAILHVRHRKDAYRNL